ncbi:nucleotidyltransferase domain-containing protein [Rheinheimera sp.]|uniref:nucleotidyltransferase family protein n=1 Tax=Rheinheimera sp. TaxID=1869214 RepID=UPI00307DAF17
MVIDRNEAVRDAIKVFCSLYGVSINSIILYGSYATGTATERSDVDVILLDDGYERGIRVQKIINGFHMQVAIMPSIQAINFLSDSQLAGHPYFPISFDMSVVLFDKFGLGNYLKEKAGYFIAKGPRGYSDSRIEMVRVGLVNYLNDGSLSKYVGETKVEKILWSSKVVRSCEDLILYKHNDWVNYNERLKSKVMNEKYAKFRLGLHSSLDEFLNDFDCVRFCERIKVVMSGLVSFDWETNERYHSDIV